MSATGRTPGKPVPVKTANPPVRTEAALDELLSTPAPALVDFMDKLQGDLLILGAGGKVGHTLARMAVRAVEASGVRRKVIGVATFSSPGVRKALERLGVETHQANLMEPGAIDRLPDAENVLYLVGRKFGSTGAEWDTWAVNVHLSGLCAQRYRRSRMHTANLAHYRAAEKRLCDRYGLAPTEHFVRLPKLTTTVRVVDVGQGQPVLFVHGITNAAFPSDFKCLSSIR